MEQDGKKGKGKRGMGWAMGEGQTAWGLSPTTELNIIRTGLAQK